MPQTFAQLEPELPLRRALFNLILFSHSPQSFNLHSHVSISKLSVCSCVSECACVHVCMCVCVCVVSLFAARGFGASHRGASGSVSVLVLPNDVVTRHCHAHQSPKATACGTYLPPPPLHASLPGHSRIWQLIRLMAELFLNAFVGTSTLNGESF